MAGFRNRIVHDYGNVDLNIVYEILKNDIPSIVNKIGDLGGNDKC